MNLKADTLYEHWKDEKDLKIVRSSEPLKALEVLGIHKLKAIHIIVVFFLVSFFKTDSNGIIDKRTMKYYYHTKEKNIRIVNLGRLR